MSCEYMVMGCYETGPHTHPIDDANNRVAELRRQLAELRDDNERLDTELHEAKGLIGETSNVKDSDLIAQLREENERLKAGQQQQLMLHNAVCNGLVAERDRLREALKSVIALIDESDYYNDTEIDRARAALKES